MLTNEDRRAIEQLFERLGDLDRSGAPRDREAEDLIARHVARQPGAAYYLAQTVVVQEQALRDAKARIDDLEGQLEQDQGGFPNRRRHGPWDRDPAFGGGFLAGAAQTALGVTGGLLLGSMLGGLFGGDANASEAQPEPEPEPDSQDELGGDDGFDGGGDFDVGGDF